MTKYYLVGGHVFGVSAKNSDWTLMDNYEPFRCEVPRHEAVFTLQITEGSPISYTEELRQDDEGQVIICGRSAQGQAVFEFCWSDKTAGWLLCDNNYRTATLTPTGDFRKLAIDNALMILYALATAAHHTVLFHAAVVSYQEQAYMFLGTSGTGKSTHARLWLQHIEGTELVNDDNPVVRLSGEGSAVVYGSPWSGKTPCYKNVSYRLGAIVGLSQAPYNKIRRLNGLEAYIILVPSISGKRWDKQIADGLHATENELVMRVPMWHLECLPDEEAAIKCNEAIAR